jgi:hypothetical protein
MGRQISIKRKIKSKGELITIELNTAERVFSNQSEFDNSDGGSIEIFTEHSS